MVKILILIIYFVIVNSLRLKKYNVKPLQKVNLEDESSCICFELDDDIKKDNNIYLNIYSEDKDAKMDKTLYYNYLEKCDNDEFCYENIYNNFTKKEDVYTERDVSDGFSFEYEFLIVDDKYRALMIQYNNFTGKELTMYYANYAGSQDLVIIIVTLIGSAIFTIIFIFLIKKLCEKCV